MKYFLLAPFIWYALALQAQPGELILPHDRCNAAMELSPGDQHFGLSNAGATTSHDETPEGQPVTCIKTFENDLWFRFTADSSYTYYEARITPRSCATPAGMQGLIIEADGCDPESFIYRACANPYAEEPLKLFLRNPLHGQNYFLYLDGYDGNVCQFDLELIGHRNPPFSLKDHQRLQLDYDQPPPLFEPQNLNLTFQNNEATLSWEVDAQSAVTLFLVERYRDGRSPYGLVLGNIQPQNTVGTGTATYRFTDKVTSFADGETYCYRIVHIGPDQNRAYSEPICIEAQLIKDFSVTQVFPISGTRKYTVLYSNRRRQDLEFSVWNADHEYLKGMTLEKAPKGNAQIDVDMSDYPPGVYYLRVSNGQEYFEREFGVE